MIGKQFFKSEAGRKIYDKYFGNHTLQKELDRSLINSKNSISTNSRLTIEDVVEEYVNKSEERIIEENKIERKYSYKPVESASLYDIVSYYKNEGVVGEESLVVAITLAAFNRINLGVEGYSGSGKTFIVDKLVDLLPEVYTLELSSKTAVLYDAARINEFSYVYIPELQKAFREKNSPVTEVIKNITEGKDVNYRTTNASKNGSDTYTITKDKTIIYTLALDNSLKKDSETDRRFMRFLTDNSETHIKEIHEYKANRRLQFTDEAAHNDLKGRIKSQLLRNSSLKVIDPCSLYVQDLFPKTQKSVSYVDHYYNLVDSLARFHAGDRISVNCNGQSYVIANIEDNYNAFLLYFDQFNNRIQEFSQSNDLLEDVIPDWNVCLDVATTVLKESPELQKLRDNNLFAVEEWEKLNSKLSTPDYKTGQVINYA